MMNSMIQSKEVISSKDNKKRVLDGVNTLANAVTSTLGASGRTVMFDDGYGRPIITKDGVSVSRNIKLKDNLSNLACTVLKESAEKTVGSCGDGTTTTILLAQYLINEGVKLVNDGYKPFEIKKGVEKATKEVIKLLDKQSIPVTDSKLKDVATISANNDYELGEIIANAFISVGKDGAVTIEESVTGETYTTSVEGLEVLRGYSNRYFITDEKKENAVLDEPLILLVDSKVQTTRELQPFLEYIASNNKSLLIIGDMDEDVTAMLLLNKMKGGLKICAINPPMFGNKRKDLMLDLAVSTGATLIDDTIGDNFENFDFSYMGKAKKAIITKSDTTLILDSSNSDKVSTHIEVLKGILDTQDNDDEKKFINERIAKLSGKVSVLNIGGKTEVEMKERLDRVEDARDATKASIQEGISPGGGIGLYDLSFIDLVPITHNKSFNSGVLLLKRALIQPLTKLLSNGGLDVAEIKNNILNNGSSGYGYDVKEDKYGSMIDMGIIDPTKVLKHSLMNAVSVAMSLLTTDYTVTTINN